MNTNLSFDLGSGKRNGINFRLSCHRSNAIMRIRIIYRKQFHVLQVLRSIWSCFEKMWPPQSCQNFEIDWLGANEMKVLESWVSFNRFNPPSPMISKTSFLILNILRSRIRQDLCGWWADVKRISKHSEGLCWQYSRGKVWRVVSLHHDGLF